MIGEVEKAFAAPSFPSTLPLVMPEFPKSMSDILELATSVPPEMPPAWLLEDEIEGDEMQITFEGKSFHYLDTSSFCGLGSDRGYDLGCSAKGSFWAGFDML
jgi:hypothetical protein